MIRAPVQRSLALSARSFSSTAVHADIFDFLRRKPIKSVEREPKKKAVPAASTSDVIKKAEEGKVEAAVRQNLRVIGLPFQPSWEESANGFDLSSPFPIKLTAPELTENQVTSVLKSQSVEILKAEEAKWRYAPLKDLGQRFQFTREVVRSLGVAIPDKVLSEAQSVDDISRYYLGKVVGRKFNEKEPDAVYFDEADFEGLNIKFEDATQLKREEKHQWKQLLRDAKKHAKSQQEKLLKDAIE